MSGMNNLRRAFSADDGARLVVALAALILAWPTSPAGAQACKDLPAGPAQQEGVMTNYPKKWEKREKKKEHCLDLARQRGATGKASGEGGFMQGCMQGTLTR